jgi:adenylate cyclase
MKESLLRATLRSVQDVICEATGAPLSGRAQQQLESILSRAVGEPDLVPASEKFSHRELTMLLADVRGFTLLAATYPAAVVLDLLDRCFVRMSEIILRHHGTIDKFMGDSIMVFFSTSPPSPEEDVRRALLCAVEMQIAMAELNHQHKKLGLPELYIGIGINTGQVVAGLLGSKEYSVYTVIGEEVNITSRIESFSLRGQVLMSEATFRYCGSFAQTGEPVEVYVKGKPDRVCLREVLGVPSLGKEVPRLEARRSPRVGVNMPFSYQAVQDKIILPKRAEGVLIDLGYHGALADVHEEIGLHGEIKLELELPLIAYSVREVYARVVMVKRRGARFLVGLEFSSLGAQTSSQIQLFVQRLIQGTA